MRFTFTYLLAVVLTLAVLPAAFAQRQFGGPGGRGPGRGGRNGNGNGRPPPAGVGQPNGGNNAAPPPNTLVTVNTAPPAATGGAAAAAAGGAGGNRGGGGGAINTALIPPFGVTPGIRANDGTANCLGVNNKAIPCDCPPNVSTLASAIQDQVARGLQFPTGSSVQDQLTRLGTSIVALQNFKGGPGSGVGCPAVSTDWVQLRTTLQGQL